MKALMALMLIICSFPLNLFAECTTGNCETGDGTYVYSDGSKYVGQWKDSVKNGEGTYFYTNGSKYVGQWKDDKKNGKGSYTFHDERKYVGEWK